MQSSDPQRRILHRRVIVSAVTDPFFNLAVEEFLFDTLAEQTGILLLYVNSPVVVIGKHQNPWLEVNLRELTKWRVGLLRRISGGGTVYHDTGNLNFSFLEPKDGFDRSRNLGFVRDVLRTIGIDAYITKKVDLYIEGGKISGNAFCFRKNRALHHGTLLVDTDVTRMHGLLSPKPLPIETHAVRSRPASTLNLSSVQHGLSCRTVQRELAKAYLEHGEVETVSTGDFRNTDVRNLSKRNRRWEWNFGRTPDFKLTAEGATATISKGLIASIDGVVSSDLVTEALTGTAFCESDLSKLLHEFPEHDSRLISALLSFAS